MGLTQISTAGVKDDAVTASKLPANSVGASELADNAVDTAAIAADAVTGAKIADDAIDSEHIAAGATDLEHMSSESVDEDNLQISNAGTNGQFLSKQSGNTGGLTWADAGSVGGATGVDFNDDVLARWGTGNDFSIKHQASDSATYIQNADGSTLVLNSSALRINNAANNENLIKADQNGSVELYEDNVKKFETSTNGVTISGRADINVGASTAAEIRLTANNTGSGAGDRGRFNVYSARNDGTAFNAGYIDIDRSSGTADESHIVFATNSGSGPAERLRVDKDGQLKGATCDAIAKAWVHAETDGTDSLVDSFNVSGVSFTNDSEIVVTFDTDFANTNYLWAGGGSRSDQTNAFSMCNIVEKFGDRAAGSCTLRTSISNSSGNVTHSTSAGMQQIMAVFYGDQ